jgi:2'-5' RNA ligase
VSRQRLFFALWPSPEQQAALSAWGARLQQMFGGRATHASTVHLTLAFIGEVAEQQIDAVLRVGDAQRGQPIDLLIDRAGCWRHNGIAWAAPAETPATLLALVHGLETALRGAGVDIETRSYRPHITLLRRAVCRATNWQPSPLHWHADRFVLVRSRPTEPGANYERLREWSLNEPLNRGD